MSRQKIIVTRSGKRFLVLAPFAANYLVKQVPGRRWEAVRKAWTIPADVEEEARDILDRWPAGVSYDDDTNTAARLRACRVCRRPMTDLGDTSRTHPGCAA